MTYYDYICLYVTILSLKCFRMNKIIYRSVIFFAIASLLLVFSFPLFSQTQSVTLEQIKVYETNKDKYINKPLKCLLRDVEYPIKKFIAKPTYQVDSVNIITFYFSDTTKVLDSGFRPKFLPK